MVNYLIDTNIAVDYLQNDEDIVAQLDNLDKVYFSIISVGELFYGAYLKSKAEKDKK